MEAIDTVWRFSVTVTGQPPLGSKVIVSAMGEAIANLLRDYDGSTAMVVVEPIVVGLSIC